MAPIALSHGDGAPGAGAEDCITNTHRFWRVELGSPPRSRPTRCPRTTTGVSQHWFSGIFDRCFFNTIALPRIIIDADVWGESSIMTGVYQCWCSSTLLIGWGLCDRVRQVLVCRGRNGLGGGGLLFILGSNLGGVGQVRGLRGGGRRGWCEEWARSG
jgi:hypothetical protein